MFNSVFKKSFNSARCKTLLRLAISRIKLLRNKRDMQLKQMKLELANMLQSNQEPSAHIRVEHIYREQNIMAAYEVIELLCELIAARLPIIESQKQCPTDLREAIASIIFAAPQCSDIPELQQIRSIFSAKYGEKFTAIAADLRPDCGVNRVVIQKLSVKGPSGEIKLKLMKDIAAEHSVDWDPSALESQRLMPPEDLLEGPSQFFGGSQMHLQKYFDEPSISEQISLQNEGNVIADAKTYVVQNTEFLDEKQFIPFVRPIGAGSQSTSSIATSHWQRSSSDHSLHVLSATPSYKYDEGVDVQPVFDRRESLRGEAAASHSSHGSSATPQCKYGESEDARPEFDRRNSLKGMAATALAAAESAERAAAAARAAVELVSEHFARTTSGSSSDSESDNNGDEVSQLQARFENIRFKSGRDPLDDSESDNNGNGVSQLQARFEHSPLKPGRDPLDDSLTYRRPLFDEPSEGAGLYRKQASGRNLTSCDGLIAGHSGSYSIFGKGRRSDDSESASHSTSRLDFKPGRDPPDDSLTYRTPLFDEPAEGKGFYRNQNSGKNSATYDGLIAGQSVSHSIFGKGGYDDYSEAASSHSTSGRDPLDSLTHKTPLFGDPAEGKGFYTKQTLGRNISGFDGPIAGHSVSHSIFGKGGHNNDSESVSHSTPRLDRHGDDQASREQLHGRNFQHYNISSFRTRSFETGATPSFDTFEWDNKPADEAAQSTTARPPERPPPKLPGPQPPTLTKSTSFVHPKLPDYDSLTAHFKALKAMKCKK